MVEEQLRAGGIRDERVLAAMGKVPRHAFVEEALRGRAYGDYPLSIGEGQTISQPLMVALMTEVLRLHGTEKVLEIGTGCGYQTAILCELAREVYSVERIARLSHRARRVLYDLGYLRFRLRIGDGSTGWPEAAPFDRIIVTAAGPSVPPAYLEQLTPEGRLVIPVGGGDQQILKLVYRTGDRTVEEALGACRFVRLIGEYGWKMERS
ncbi:MAG: protein-L-isoaspartate(D-aspartate) O-methyltransferase [Deltaproteobacteria bacterium]|nr:protein-L-isoaspartate(D-aspartate) O-methyltransferase [Deltaproteobacteria bacterium]